MWETIIIGLKLVRTMIWFNIWNWMVGFWPGFQRPVVEVRQGRVRGITSVLPNGGSYHFFKGIPYAKSPTGRLRFQSPVPLQRFNQPVLNCSVEKAGFIRPCMFSSWFTEGSEDGLFLSVYTPGLPVNDLVKYPVMVFVHGGGFRTGTASEYFYDPKYLVQRGVVVVIMSYRLGPLGFLSMPSVGISGNAGLKDQRLALQWVQENIHKFGGDAQNVTFFGQSAGSMSVYLHYLSPKSRQYFHRAICMSGVMCTESDFQVEPEEKARKLARLLGYRGTSDNDVLETLLKASARSLIRLQNHVASQQEEGDPLQFLFRPVIEQDVFKDAIITQSPERILKSFDTLRLPIMLGTICSEGVLAFVENKNNLSKYNKHVSWLVPRFMEIRDEIERKTIGDQIKQFYLGNQDIGSDTTNETCNLMTDLTFSVMSNLSSELLAKYQPNVKQYCYLFSFIGRCNITKTVLNVKNVDGAAHTDDIFNLFGTKVLPHVLPDSDEYKMREILATMLTNFAKFDDPTPNEALLGFKWTPNAPVHRDSEQFDMDCAELCLPPRMIRNPNQGRKEFWRNLLRKHTGLM